MKKSVATLMLFVSLFITGLVRAESHNGITLDNLLIRAVHGGMAVTAGFVTITNTGSDDDRLISVSTGFAGKSELHTMAVENGIMKMRPLADGIIIPAGESVTLKPGELHLMFMKLTETPQIGETRDVTFVFEKAGTITATADVAKVHHGH